MKIEIQNLINLCQKQSKEGHHDLYSVMAWLLCSHQRLLRVALGNENESEYELQ